MLFLDHQIFRIFISFSISDNSNAWKCNICNKKTDYFFSWIKMSFARLTRDAHKSENGGRHSRKNGGWPRIMNWSAVENGLTTILEIEATIIVLLLDASQRGGRGRYHRGHWTSLFRFHEIFRVMSISQDFLPIIFGCTLHICKIITELVLFFDVE